MLSLGYSVSSPVVVRYPFPVFGGVMSPLSHLCSSLAIISLVTPGNTQVLGLRYHLIPSHSSAGESGFGNRDGCACR